MKKEIALLLIFIGGYVGLAAQLLVLRQVANFVGATAIISSIIIGVYLAAMTGGYFTGSRKVVDHSKIARIVSRNFILMGALITLAASYPIVSLVFHFMLNIGITSPIVQTFAYAAVFLAVLPFLSGYTISLLAQTLHNKNRDYTGIIMGIDTVGSVLGSLVTTLIIMAVFGVNYAVMTTVFFALVASFVAKVESWGDIALPRYVFFTSIILVLLWGLNNSALLKRTYGIVSNNAASTIAIVTGVDGMYLMIDSATHSLIRPDGRHAEYVDFINDFFINTIPADKTARILVLGAGGFTIGRHDNRNLYTFVDINPALKYAAERYFLPERLGANKRFVVQDAGQFLRTTTEKYDLIIMDVFSRWSIPESMITDKFMAEMRAALAPGGFMIMNAITSPVFADEFSRRLDNTIRQIFPHNLSRHIVMPFNAWGDRDLTNVLYIYVNHENRGLVYDVNRSSTIYDKRRAH